MIGRYTREEMGRLWTDAARMEAWRRVEVAACEEMEGPTAEELDAVRGAAFTVEEVAEREEITDHDVAAFVDVLSASAGPAGRWIHFGLTSSDVLDTALGLQIRAAGELIVPAAYELVAALAAQAREHVDTLCVGRTHGVHAEPTTFGVKLAGFAWEAQRNAERLERAFQQASYGAVSGAVGTYSATSPAFEARVLSRLGLRAEPASTQVVPRDRHAELLGAISLAGAGLERFATELRNLQRTEVREVEEPFRAGQKGSSAMPHKRNPITSERLTGLARVLRGYASTATENVALWHERDISHSGAERVILPDATILLDYMQSLALRLARGMNVHADRMLANLDMTHGALFSQRVLLALLDKGLTRDEAYRIAQEAAQKAWDEGRPLRQILAQEHADRGLDLDAIFDYSHYTRYSAEIVGRLDKIAARDEPPSAIDAPAAPPLDDDQPGLSADFPTVVPGIPGAEVPIEEIRAEPGAVESLPAPELEPEAWATLPGEGTEPERAPAMPEKETLDSEPARGEPPAPPPPPRAPGGGPRQMAIHSRDGDPITSADEWSRLAGPEVGQADSADVARFWLEPSNQVAVAQALSEEIGEPVEFLDATPGKPVAYDAYPGEHWSDLLITGTVGSSPLIVFVDAKVNARFDKTVEDLRKDSLARRLRGDTETASDRLDGLVTSLLGAPIEERPDAMPLRLELLVATMATVVQAEDAGAPEGVLLVQSFETAETASRDADRNRADLASFVSALTGAPHPPGVDDWITGPVTTPRTRNAGVTMRFGHRRTVIGDD